MVFSSSIFLFVFLPILVLLYFIVPSKAKNIVLLSASLVFYSWGEPRNIAIMLFSIFINYLFGIAIEKNRKNSGRKVILWISIIVNIGILFIFKYLNFAVGILNQFTGKGISINEIALPIGISFYTFQILSYVIDVYRESVEAQHNVLSLALYVSLFPQLIAGPIVRYVDVKEQMACRSTCIDNIGMGARRFMLGFSKKVLLADQLSSLVDQVFIGKYPSIISNWVGIAAYTLQIFFDFSGYSDMAIGLGKIFGFDFLENFDYPYISKSIKEFWRRWHMSLGSWFRDYVYIPLGGSRAGTARTYINLLIVFFLTGLWHGASYNYIVWGLFYAFFLIIERTQMGGTLLKKVPAWVQHVYTILVIMIGWVFFRADNLDAAVHYIEGMLIPAGNDLINFEFIMNKQYAFFIIVAILFSFPHKRFKLYFRKKWCAILRNAIIVIIFIMAISCMVGSGYSPFLYFRF